MILSLFKKINISYTLSNFASLLLNHLNLTESDASVVENSLPDE